MTNPFPNRPSDRAASTPSNSLDASTSDSSPKRCVTGVSTGGPATGGAFGFGICPVCAGALFEIRGKLQCRVCHTICETCCEGGRQ